MSVLSTDDFEIYYYDTPEIPFLFFATEQLGHCTAGPEVPEFLVDFYKGGDSGSPNMIPTPDGQLVFFRGTATTGPNSQMQSDVDALSTYLGLDPGDYQLQWYQPEPQAP
jgi:hypothetical protein